MNTGAAVAPTLRQRLLSHVLLPVFTVWLTSTALVIEIAYVYTQRAFDRALIDDAYALSAHVRQSGEGLTLELSARELDSVLFDQSEKVYFAVVGIDGRVLANNAPWLVSQSVLAQPGAVVDTGNPYVLGDRFHEGEPLRSVELLLSEGRAWRVILAQTVRSRTNLVQQMLFYAVVPEVLLFTLLGIWLWWAIGRDLDPMNRLRQALQSRDVTDLSPVPVDASSRDVAQVAQAVNALFARSAGRPNTAFGTAFDINARYNRLGTEPAGTTQAGCVYRLVPVAHEFGFYWGGHFSRRDGMHFELARLL